MFNIIISGWNFFRIVKLLIGLFFLVDGIITKQWPIVVLAFLYTLIPLFNFDCYSLKNCSNGNCSTSTKARFNAEE